MRGALIVLLAASSAAAQEGPRVSAGGQFWTSSAVALETGLILGVTGEAQLRLEGPLFASARLAVGSSEEANVTWLLEHRHGVAALGLGADVQLGVGRAWAHADLGAMVVWEVARRHQYERLQELRVPGVVRESWSLGPKLGAEVGLEVRFWGPWAMVLSGGPYWTWQQVDGALRGRFAFESGLGVARAF